MTKRGRLSDGDDHDDEHPLKKGKRTEQVRKQANDELMLSQQQREEAAFLNRRFKKTAKSEGHKKQHNLKNQHHSTDKAKRVHDKTKQKHYLFVSNLSKRVKENDLKKQFKVFGKVEHAVIIPQGDRTMNYGFIYFYTKQDATSALKMNGTPFKGEPIHVEPGRRVVFDIDDVYSEARRGRHGQPY